MRKNITSSASAWIVELGQFVTLWMDGTFRTPNGFIVDVDPTAVTFVADSVVRRLSGRDEHFRRIGATASPTALATLIRKGAPDGTRPAYVMTIDGLLEHPVFGKNVPTVEQILDANTEA